MNTLNLVYIRIRSLLITVQLGSSSRAPLPSLTTEQNRTVILAVRIPFFFFVITLNTFRVMFIRFVSEFGKQLENHSITHLYVFAIFNHL